MAARRCWSTDSTRSLWPKRLKSCWLRCDRTPLSFAPWETIVARAGPSLPITREMSARPWKALVVSLTFVPFKSWLPTSSAFSSWGML